jgi:hypothetical protein
MKNYSVRNIFKRIGYIGLGGWVLSCAVVKAPQGGPKDTQAPQVVSQIPINNSTNFKGTELTIEFDEYFKLNNFSNEIIVNPYIDPSEINTIVRGKNLLIFLPTLKENTTYSIDFGKSVVDITEGNPLQNYKMIFSTGDLMNNFSVNGNIKTKLDISDRNKVVVGLYGIADSINPVKHKPDYYTKTNTKSFSLANVNERQAKVFAFTDNNNNLLYDPKSESIAFLNDLIVTSDPDTLELNLFKEETRTFKMNRPVVKENFIDVEFTKGLKTINIKDGKNYKYITNKNTLRIYDIENNNNFSITVTDSLNTKIDTSFTNLTKYSKMIDSSFTVNTTTQYKNNKLSKGIVITAEHKFEIFDNSKILYVIKGDTSNVKPSNFSFTQNNISDTMIVSSSNDTDTLNIIFEKGALKTPNGFLNKRIVCKYIPIKKESYGDISGDVQTSVPNYFLILTNSKGKEIARLKNCKTFKFEYLEAGSYKINILIDENNNGIYDTGNVLLRKQPEKIIDVNKALDVKANWSVGNIHITF